MKRNKKEAILMNKNLKESILRKSIPKKSILKEAILLIFVLIGLLIFSIILIVRGDKNDSLALRKKEDIMKAFWNSNTIEDESVMLVSKQGGLPRGNLIFAPTKVIKVISYSLEEKEKLWIEGVDYVIKDNTIIALHRNVPHLTDMEVTGEEKIDGLDYSSIPSMTKGLFLPFTESFELLYRQVYITYEYDEKWMHSFPIFAGDKLKNTYEKLVNQEELNIFVYGDSISTGANSTGYLKVYPFKPSWPELVVENLGQSYGGKINLTNKSVGGWTSENAIMSTESIGWIEGKQISRAGIKATLASMPDYQPDLVILGFGMNDATMGIDHDTYKAYMKKIISNIRERNSQCEFILIGTMLANPMARNQSKDQISYYKVLEEIAAQDTGISTVNLGEMHQSLLEEGKEYMDLTSNNVNHPNDFMAKIYAMNILSLLISGN